MDKNTQDPKEIERLLATVEDWQEQIKIMEQEPEFAHTDFFKLLTSIIEDARAATRPPEMLEKCEQALEQAAELYDKTGRLEFFEWASLLNGYMKTWDEDLWKDDSFENPVLFANPLLQAEIATINRMDEQEPPMERVSAAFDDMSQMLQGLSVTDAESMQGTTDAVQKLTEKLGVIKNYMSLFRGTTHVATFAKLLDETAYQLQRIADETAMLVQDNIDTVLSYLDKEIKKPKYKGLSLKELMEQSKDEDGNYIEGSLFLQACRAASERMQAENAFDTTNIKKPVDFLLPLDKLNRNIWKLLETDTGEQISFAAEKNGSKKQLDILYSINFDNLPKEVQITKKLTSFDKRVHTAVSALFNAGNTIITLSQIHYAMGNTSRPGDKQLVNINNSLSKMTGARIYINNTDEAKSYKYPKFVYDGSLLPFERKTAIVNGKTTDAAIYVFREPPMTTFARERKQITTLPLKLLQSPANQTDENLSIEDYLLERIAYSKHGTGSNKIKLSRLCEECGITTTKQKQRLPGKLIRYMDYYVSCSHIKKYKLDDDSITFYI